MIRITPKLITALLLLSLAASLHAQPDPEPAQANLYWPGDFEHHLYGGIYSSDMNLTLTDQDNHTAGGRHAWALQPGKYAHLELLTPGRGRYELRAMTRAQEPATLQLKVISPGEAADSKPSETVYDIPLTASGKWEPVRVVFDVTDPYPGPVAGELLLGGYNPTDSAVLIDDVCLYRVTHTPLPVEREGKPLASLTPDAFVLAGGEGLPGSTIAPRAGMRQAVVLAHHANAGKTETGIAATADAWVDAATLRGRAIVLAVDAGLLTVDLPSDPWAGLVVALHAQTPSGLQRLEPTPNPHWLPVGQAPRPTAFKTIRSAYRVPDDAERVRVQLILQAGVGPNHAAVTSVRFSALPDPTPSPEPREP